MRAPSCSGTSQPSTDSHNKRVRLMMQPQMCRAAFSCKSFSHFSQLSSSAMMFLLLWLGCLLIGWCFVCQESCACTGQRYPTVVCLALRNAILVTARPYANNTILNGHTSKTSASAGASQNKCRNGGPARYMQ